MIPLKPPPEPHEWSELPPNQAPNVPSALGPQTVARGGPSQVFTRTAADGVQLTCIVAGDGKAHSPWALHLRASMPGQPDAEVRYPTLEEMQDAVNRFTLEGSVMSMGVLQSSGPDATMAPAVGEAGLAAVQIGGAPGSRASQRLQLTGGIVVRPQGGPDA